MTTGRRSEASVVGNDSGAFKFKPEPHFPQSLLSHGVPQLSFVFGVKHQKTSATRTDQLATGCAIGESTLIPVIDFFITHSGATAFLVLPMNVHQPPEFGYITVFERTLRGKGEFLHEMEIVCHFRIGTTALLVLVFQNCRCRSGKSGKKQQ